MSGLTNFREMEELLEEDSFLKEEFKALREALLTCNKENSGNAIENFAEFLKLVSDLATIPKTRDIDNINTMRFKWK